MSVYERGGVYYYEFVHRGQRYREITRLTNKTSALRVEALRKADVLQGRVLFECPPFESFIEEEFMPWAKATKKPSTAKPLVRLLKKTRLDRITPAVVENIKLRRLKECSGAGVNRGLAALRFMLNFAIKHRCLRDDPVKMVKFLDEGPGCMRILSTDEETLYLAPCPKKLWDVSVIMLNTGMRPKEVYATREEDAHKEHIFIPRGKTRFARRSIPLTDKAREVLSVRKREAKNGWLFPHRTDPERHMVAFKSFADLARSIGLDFRLYDLRHTFGSRAVMAGVDLPTLKELMGHSTITMTMRYIHPTPEHKIEALKKLENFQLSTPKSTPTPTNGENGVPLSY